jgi:hypothetical protein
MNRIGRPRFVGQVTTLKRGGLGPRDGRITYTRHDARRPAYEWLIKEAVLGTRKLLH